MGLARRQDSVVGIDANCPDWQNEAEALKLEPVVELRCTDVVLDQS